MNTVEEKSFAQKETLGKVEINGETFYKMPDVHTMRPFFMSIVSDSDHWLFVASNGGISAGRKNAGLALFPYYTDDKIIDTAEVTGSKTIVRFNKNGKTILWEPFSVRSEGHFTISRNLYQNKFGNKIIFEEFNHELELSFQYEWNTSDVYGFVRHARLQNYSDTNITIALLDGVHNVLPYGIPSNLQTKTSNLADAYKRSELTEACGLGIFALSAIIVDKAEPSEALKANIVWSKGLEKPVYLLSDLQLQNFRNGKPLVQETDIKGEKGAYYVACTFMLGGGTEKHWFIAANVNQTQAAIVRLEEAITNDTALYENVLGDIALGSERLQQLNASADGLQYTADDLKDTRHCSNVLFNIMRGGIFDDHYRIEKWDFISYLKRANRLVYEAATSYMQSLADTFSVFELRQVANQSGNADLIRLATEYLPLKFSRRHGDPSRPWNQFSINTKHEDGSKILDYEGNWRDIFQNWEALVHAYPEFIEGMIFKFLNASTFDGYNPYRITKDGFDWETIEPDNPWSYIGYWGDHQIIYLLKFLEFAEQHRPGVVNEWLPRNVFVYANVPYRIKSYSDIVSNAKETIDFDSASEKHIRERMRMLGADGALVTGSKGDIYHANFLEKILATVLCKLSNFIPEAGIWMNTQRPEWNDANNALVGNGVSMVTLCYLRRFLRFFYSVLQAADKNNFEVSEELYTFFVKVAEVFTLYSNALAAPVDDSLRKKITDALGTSGSNYRDQVYTRGFSGGHKSISAGGLLAFVSVSTRFVEHAIKANRRADNLYHAYNLLTYTEEGIHISHLSEMLEGQVAVLSSGMLSAGESLQLLDALRQSSLYREDQDSYMLYPNKQLPGFMTKNHIPKNLFETSSLLMRMAGDGNTSVAEKDLRGNFHFNGNFKNAADVALALDEPCMTNYAATESEKSVVLQIFETVFNHKAFTGRSGTFYGYEGLGSIYWHMVSKLLLAVQETCLMAIRREDDSDIIKRLVTHYYQINDGIGIHKAPAVFGAFSITPYSHTPFNKGAQQPGMTGQVKEDILCRIGELGLSQKDGRLCFAPVILRRNEFLPDEKEAVIIDLSGRKQKISLEKDTLLFTCCQVPVIYKLSKTEYVEVTRADGSVDRHDNLQLSSNDTTSVWKRDGAIKQLKVFIKESSLILY